MRKVTFVYFICLTLLAISQDHRPEILLRPSGPAPRWDKGQVEGRTYRNASVGVELTPPHGLEFVGGPELNGTPGTLPLLVTITAAGETTLLTARKVIAFYTDALAYYPSARRSTDAYMLRIVFNQRNDGYAPVGSTSQDKLGGVVFWRQDFKKGVVYESVFVKACDTQALVFIFGAGDLEAVNKLSAATELKLDQAKSGCFSSGAVAQDKPPVSFAEQKPAEPVLKVAVMSDGRITVDGALATVELLRESLKKLSRQKGVVWYYRESANTEGPPVVKQVMQAIIDARLPIRFSSQADYSDTISPDGKPMKQ